MGYVLNARRAVIRNEAKVCPSTSHAMIDFIASTVEATR
jgi:hypothetical protein